MQILGFFARVVLKSTGHVSSEAQSLWGAELPEFPQESKFLLCEPARDAAVAESMPSLMANGLPTIYNDNTSDKPKQFLLGVWGSRDL